MTHYFFDPKTNTLHGPIDRMPPVWDYGFPPDGPSDSQLASAEADYDDAWKAFNIYLQSLPSIPHTFTGPSRVVPEGEIEWRYEYRDFETSDWKECTHRTWWKIDDDKFRRAVATPITEEGKGDVNHGKTCYCNACASKRRLSEEASIPAHIVDDMKLDSYYDGFKDGAKLTEEVKRDKHQNCNCPNEQHNEGCLFHPNNDGAPGYTSTSGEEEGDLYDAVLQYRDSHPEPLTAQPDKPAIDRLVEKLDEGNFKITFGLQPHHIKRINEQAEKWGENNHLAVYSTHFWDNLAKEFAWEPFTLALYYFNHTNTAPSPTPQQGDKELTMIELPKPTGDFILSQKDIAYKQASDGAYWHYKDVITLLHRYAAQQPQSPALQGELVDALIYTITEANANGDQYGEIKSKVAALLSPAQPLTTDEEAAKAKAISEWGNEDYHEDERRNYENGFTDGCTHVRSQQQEGLLFVAIKELENERAIDKNNVNVWYNNGLEKAIIILKSIQRASPQQSQQPVDAVALLQIAVNLVDRAYKHNDKEVSEWLAIANKFVTEANAIASGSQASNQSEGELWKEVAGIIYEHDGKLVAIIDRLKERFHITPKTQQHD